MQIKKKCFPPIKKIVTIFILVLYINALKAQVTKDLQTTCSTAAQGIAGNFVISYTIGEMLLVNNFKVTGLYVTNGIYQPKAEIFSPANQAFLDGEILVFPNPTPNLLSIQYNILQVGKMTAQLYDATGKKLLADEIAITSFSTKKYDITKYANGMYVLVLQYVSNDGATIKKGKYKILKM